MKLESIFPSSIYNKTNVKLLAYRHMRKYTATNKNQISQNNHKKALKRRNNNFYQPNVASMKILHKNAFNRKSAARYHKWERQTVAATMLSSACRSRQKLQAARTKRSSKNLNVATTIKLFLCNSANVVCGISRLSVKLTPRHVAKSVCGEIEYIARHRDKGKQKKNAVNAYAYVYVGQSTWHCRKRICKNVK